MSFGLLEGGHLRAFLNAAQQNRVPNFCSKKIADAR
jgi:hypothetical protein